jgi:EAL domain-containing protein (putative c-di-GMP-specific phosphodiesterase class I)
MGLNPNRVLVLDDEVTVCRWVARVATQCRFEVTTTQEADEFKALCESFEPSLILLDLVLGSRDGIEVLRALAAASSRVPIVLMSGLDERVLNSASRLGQALDLQIAGAVLKPLALGDLRALFDTHRCQALAEPIAEVPLLAEAAASTSSGPHGVLDASALVVHYQPQCWMANAAVAGAEALVRWQHPDLGLVAPSTFLQRAERTGFMRALTCAVLSDAVGQCRRWASAGHKVPVSVNLSPGLLDDLTLPDDIERITLAAGVSPADVTLEVTESVAVARRQLAMDVLTRLRLKGFRLALDDFGVGFSSLLELQHMPFTDLKIDKSFVFDAVGDASARAIVDAVIGLGHKLSLRIVAEGIENDETWTLLRDAGCDVGQGYLLSPPVDAVSFNRFLVRQHRASRPRVRVAARS